MATPPNESISVDFDDNEESITVEGGDIDSELVGGEAGQIRMVKGDLVSYADPDQVKTYLDLGYTSEQAYDSTAIDKAFERGRQEEYGDIGSQIEAGSRAFLRGATFDQSERLLGDEKVGQILRETNPVTSIIGEVGGAVLPTLFSGAPGIVGGAVRLSPRAALAAASAKYVGRGATTAGRVGRGAVTGLAEGGAETAGAYYARQALEENPKESGSSFGTQLVTNMFLGGIGGGIGGALTKADEAADVLRAIPEDEVSKFRSLMDVTTEKGTRRTTDATSKKILKSTDDLDLEDIASPSMITRSRQSYSKLQDRIATSSARNAESEVDELLSNPFLKNALSDEEYLTLTAKMRGLASEYTTSAKAAKSLGEVHGSIVGNAKNAKEFGASLKHVSEELDSDFSNALAKLDESTVDLDQEISTLKNALAGVEAIDPKMKAAASFDPNIADRIRQSITSVANSVKANPVISKTIDIADDIAGVAEIANQFGLDVPSLSQLAGGKETIAGQGISLWLSAKAGYAALGRTGVQFTSNSLNNAAAKYNQAKIKFLNGLESGIRAATTAINKKRSVAAPLLATGLVQAANNINRENVRAKAAQEASNLPTDVATEALAQVDRTLNYLEKNRPKNPNQGTDWQKEWKADPVAENEFARRTRAALDPLYAIDRIFSTPNNTLEVEALKQVHPELFIQAQSRLLEMTPEERKAMREPMKQSLGRAFGVPLQINQLPGYASIKPTQAAASPAPDFGQPSVSSNTGFVKAEKTNLNRRG